MGSTFLTSPADDKQNLNIELPWLIMILKGLKKNFTFEVQVLDDKNIRRRFRASTYISATRVKPFICSMPLKIDEGWNHFQFNLEEFVKKAYQTEFKQILRVQIHANCRIRRLFFSNKPSGEDDIPNDFKYWNDNKKTDENSDEMVESRRYAYKDRANASMASPSPKNPLASPSLQHN